MTLIRHIAILAVLVFAARPAGASPIAAKPTPRHPANIILVQGAVQGCRIDDMSGMSGVNIALAITLPPGSETESGTLFLGGLPDEMGLTAGSRLKSLWAIQAGDVRKTAIIAPPAVHGQFTLRLQCIIGGRQFEDTAKLTVEAVRVESTAPAIPRPAKQTDAFTSHPLMKQADELLAAGDIARARLLYEHLAIKGSPRAAFSLGRTYDPAYLSSIYVRGVGPNVELATRWYRLADDLGVPEARDRLSALGK